MRTYDVEMTLSKTTYLSVVTLDRSLYGDLWFASWGGVIFRWNGTEDGFTSCGSKETVGSTPFCLYGEGPWSAASDGTISGVLNGGVDFGDERCLNQSHRFVPRPKT